MPESSEIAEWLRLAGELGDQDRHDEAIDYCNKVLDADPDNYKALFCLGSVLLKLGKHIHASQLLRRVCELMPQDRRGWSQLAICCAEQHRYDEAIRHAERALALKREVKTLADCSYVHVNAGNWDRAEKYALEALKLEPGNVDALWQMANIDLAKGRWVEGWKGYRLTQRTKWRKEWQYTRPDGKPTEEWQGEPDAVVMVTGEQGLGDEIMAASVVPDAAKACKRFIFDCDERLGDLFVRSFPGAIVSPTRRSADVRLPVLPTHHKTLFGLAELFRRDDAAFQRRAYLEPNHAYVTMFKTLLANLPDAEHGVTGLAWSGGFPRTGATARRAGLEAFYPVTRKGGAFVSLQYKDDAAEVAAFERAHGIKVWRFPWVTQGPDMDLLAGFLAALDGVVGVHTTALHLASALGVPTTVLTYPGSGWRYARDELLWYPQTTRMHNKSARESWRDCVERMAREQMRRAA